jgi:hypothetical protein
MQSVWGGPRIAFGILLAWCGVGMPKRQVSRVWGDLALGVMGEPTNRVRPLPSSLPTQRC